MSIGALRRWVALAVVSAGCATLAAGAVLPGNAPASGFAQALAVRAFAFPADHGPHPAFRQEWWYVTGNLKAADGERFGFELTFFRLALTPPPPAPMSGTDAASAPSAWRAREIYMAHFAVTDVARRRFRFAQKFERAALGLAGARTGPPGVWLDDWSLQGAGGSGDRADVDGGSGSDGATTTAMTRWRLHAVQEDYALELELLPQSAPVLNGDHGLSRKADEPSAASYYYSVPRLAARGRLLREGTALAVSGEAWLDREWGSGGLGAQQAGWDWFGLQLDDGSALMFYALRRHDGSRDPHSAGTWISASGETRALTDTDAAIEVTHEWRNAHGDRYPAGWRIRVPALLLDVALRPVLPDQELGTSPRYWEGAVDVSGARAARPLAGRGYVELVGYAKER